MNPRRVWILARLVMIVAALTWGVYLGRGQNVNRSDKSKLRSTTQAQRKAARLRAAPQKTGVSQAFAGLNQTTKKFSPLASGLSALAAMGTAYGAPDYFGVANWANSPLPQLDATGTIVAGTGIRKFVDALPGLCAVSGPTLTLGQCIPLATADTTTYPGSDFFQIGLRDSSRKMHTDLPATKLRGYTDLNPLGASFGVNQYLGPLILATRNRPVRVLFTNQLAAGAAGNLFIPTDTTYMGAGMGPDGTNYTQNRATLHLHGGNTPWISDGTPHQWTVPAGEATSYPKGVSVYNVPDMPNPGKPGSPDPGAGSLTFYWTNQQSGRLMFYHDHAYGITRLNVYSGEAAGYLLVDPAEETALKNATVPGTIVTNPATGAIVSQDLGHLIPLVIQDKTFVPDNGGAGGQLAATDPTWPSPANPLPDGTSWPAGSLWFPHVYMPNQNPFEPSGSGANPYGRWDYGPWFWPPQNPSTFDPQGQPYPCTSLAYPGVNLTCPGTPNPTGTPEGFMDTPVVNGTAYPKLTVEPTAYRFKILSAGNDRALNLGLYVADPLTVAVTNGGSGYNAAPQVQFTPSGATATATVSTGSVDSVAVVTGGSGYVCPSVLFLGGGGSGAAAIAAATGGVITGIVVTNGGKGYTSPPTVAIQDPCGSGSGATGTASITPAGVVVAITVTNPGAYTSAPTVSFVGGGGSGAAAIATVNTEVKMVDAVPHTVASALPLCSSATQLGGAGLAQAAVSNGVPIYGTGLPSNCWPTTWPTDGRDGGVPDPLTAGPPIIQIGTEGGAMPSVAVIPSTPVGYEYNRRSITVLNVYSHGLFLGPAERADVVIDFSAFAGKTLILHNDAPAPVPAFDPRADYYTGNPDNTLSGGAPSTMPGYGPNTRTLMQIQVLPTASGSKTFNLATLQSALPGIFASTQDQIIIPETAYPAGNGGAAANSYARIQDTLLYLGGSNGALVGLTLTNPGSGYTSAPTVSIASPSSGVTATAIATLGAQGVGSVTVTAPGSGYTSAPTVGFSGGGGSGGMATASMKQSVASITVNNRGSGYTSTPTVTVAPPGCAPNFGPTCQTATAQARLAGSKVNSITVTFGGYGYSNAPTVTISGGGGTGAAATANLTTTYHVFSVAVTNPGTYTSAPTVTFTGGGGSGAAATDTLTTASVASLTLTNAGSGYAIAPTVTISPPPPGGVQAAATASLPSGSYAMLPKAIVEDFTKDYGRMNALLGVEMPFTSILIQTTIPYGYADPPTEIFNNGETQVWKITHNGVDTHFIHFHLFSVQVINRVGWDGAIKPPDPNEMSWKDTVRMNPLEDIIVALRPFKQQIPWDLPNSIRPLDVTAPIGSATPNEFWNVDPTNEPAPVTNDVTNFGWEYVWHCHILGHEENDMMRAMIMAVPPIAPTILNVNGGIGSVTLRWKDNSLNETGFTIQRATASAGPWTTVATVPVPNGATTGPMTYTDTVPAGTYYYQVIANNMVGYTKGPYPAPAVGYPHLSADSAPAGPAGPVTVQ